MACRSINLQLFNFSNLLPFVNCVTAEIWSRGGLTLKVTDLCAFVEGGQAGVWWWILTCACVPWHTVQTWSFRIIELTVLDVHIKLASVSVCAASGHFDLASEFAVWSRPMWLVNAWLRLHRHIYTIIAAIQALLFDPLIVHRLMYWIWFYVQRQCSLSEGIRNYYFPSPVKNFGNLH